MKVYLDNCSFNRPFDNQVQLIIRLETEAKLFIQAKIVAGEIQLIWSYILEYENALNPFPERKEMILEWKKMATETILEAPKLLLNAREILNLGLKPKDALHLACAVEASCDFFITTDRGILKKLDSFEKVRIISPINFLNTWEEK
jgi:predicted nucleic acid-binding protein